MHRERFDPREQPRDASHASSHASSHDEPDVDAQKPRDVVLEQQASQATEELERPTLPLLLSGLTAGLDLGFGPFAMAVGGTLMMDVLSRPALTLLQANLYTIGFLFVIVGRSALFTEQTASAVQPVLARKATVAQLLRLWGLVLVSNLVGGVLFAALAAPLGRGLAIVEPSVLAEMAHRVTVAPTDVMFLSAVAAGWIMGLVSWLVVAARDTTAQILAIWAATMLIGLAGLHHSIAGASEILLAVFAGAGATWADLWRFLAIAIPGNAVGGVVFVALLKFRSARAEPADA